MQKDELYSLISRTAELMEQFERRSKALEQRMEQLTQRTSSVIEQWPSILQQSADSSLKTLPLQVIHHVKDGLDRPVADYQARLHTSASELADRVHPLSRQVE